MASTSFSLPNKLFARQFAAIPPPHSPITLRTSLRVSAAYATAERTEIAARTASFYDVLGIEADATCHEIKSAYRKLARTLHPDVASRCGGGDDAADDFMRVHAAYATLSDPEKRALYDNSLFRRRRRQAVTSDTGYSAVTRQGRSWETDQCCHLRNLRSFTVLPILLWHTPYPSLAFTLTSAFGPPFSPTAITNLTLVVSSSLLLPFAIYDPSPFSLTLPSVHPGSGVRWVATLE
ncbi:Chaperone DnaJ-domain superfamily protein [Perilla frutescens var. frutescens]|nr:Chaperone DnaJ-domain superfamily protein [Perilla frutescens var. frutescens]